MLPSLRMFVSTAIMQFLSAGEWSHREETHARDPYLELCDGSAIHLGLVDGFHGQANTLVVPKGQLGSRFQNAVGVDGLDCLVIERSRNPDYDRLDADATAKRPSSADGWKSASWKAFALAKA